jgi:hypothetical protein
VRNMVDGARRVGAFELASGLAAQNTPQVL